MGYKRDSGPAEYTQRLTVWQAAIETAKKHIQIGIGLQSQGGFILKNISTQTGSEATAKLIQQATATIEKGCKIEREANNTLIALYNQEPRP